MNEVVNDKIKTLADMVDRLMNIMEKNNILVGELIDRVKKLEKK